MTIRLSPDGGGNPIELQLDGADVKIYVCGVTPYDATHLGHVATFLTYDVLERRLRELGHRTRMVRNITDLDEPILPRARQLGVPYMALVEAEIRQFEADMECLGMLRPEAQPRVSQMLDSVTGFVEELTAGGYTYNVRGTTYFDTSRSKSYGALSGYPEDLRIHLSRERGGDPDGPEKRHRLDFVLWRPAAEGEPTFESPFGVGMPGWHIGCSAMARALLGPTVDLHGGGIDLVFPHHECEQAQTLAVQTEPFVRTWHHCQLVGYQGAKMSKSRGNLVLARDLLRQHSGAAIRLALLGQYRYTAGCDWRDADITRGERLLELLQAAVRVARGPDPRPWAERVRAAIDDDLDFPTAVAELADLARTTLAHEADDPATPDVIAELSGLLGVDVTGVRR